jgi:hypothetical protein
VANGAEARFFVGPVTKSNHGDVYSCYDSLDGSAVTSDPLNVQYAPGISIIGGSRPVSLSGTFSITFNIDSNPGVVLDGIVLLKGDRMLSGEKYTANTTSATIFNIACDDGGIYTIQGSNLLGRDRMMFNLTVQQVLPTFMAVPTVQVGITPVDVGLTSYVNGCPDRIHISCNGGMLKSVVDVRNRTPVLWKRSDFFSGLGRGSRQVTCTASNSQGVSTTSFSVTSGEFCSCYNHIYKM